MSTLAGDFWVCGQCRSINNAGARQCYNCRTPKQRAEVDPASIDPTSDGQLRDVELPRFRSSRGIAALASGLIVAVALLQAVNAVNESMLLNQIIDGTPQEPEQAAFLMSLRIVTLGVGALALIAWSLWLSRAVTAMPALGLGYPAADGLMAFVENFLPGLNLFRVPAIVRDVVNRLDPGGARGEALIFAAWIGLLAGFVVPRGARVLLGVGDASDPGTLRMIIVLDTAATGFVLVGAIFLVALMWWVEGRIARRRVAQLGEAAPATPGAGSATTEPVAEAPSEESTFADIVRTRSALAATGESSRWDASQASPGPVPAGSPETVGSPSPAAVGAPPIIVADETVAAEAPPPAEPPRVEPEPEIAGAPAPAVPEPEIAAAPAAAVPEPEIAAVAPAEPEPVAAAAVPAEPAAPEPVAAAAVPAEPAEARPPHLTIRVSARGMITAELDGESEHVILDDLESYATALANVDGTATIVVTTEDSMATLIARRAQRILEDGGVRVTSG